MILDDRKFYGRALLIIYFCVCVRVHACVCDGEGERERGSAGAESTPCPNPEYNALGSFERPLNFLGRG